MRDLNIAHLQIGMAAFKLVNVVNKKNGRGFRACKTLHPLYEILDLDTPLGTMGIQGSGPLSY